MDIYQVLSTQIRRLVLILLLLSLSACSLYLDPEICESNADCNGGICQVGVCIGAELLIDASLDSGDIAGEMIDLGSAGDQVAGDQAAGDQVAGDEIVAGIEAGEVAGEPLDMMMNDLFECDIVSTSLTRMGAILRDLPPEIDGSTHWLTNAEELSIEVSFNTPDNEVWAEKISFYLGEETIEIVEDNGAYHAQLTLADEGEYRARLIVGSTEDIKCVDQLFLTVDRSEPELTLLSPIANETWIGQLSGEPQTRLSLESRDLTRVSLSVTDSNSMMIASRTLSDDLLWSADLSLREGENTFKVTARDELSAETETNLTFYYDPYPPGIGLTQPESDRLTIEGNNLTVSGFVYQRTGLGGVGGEGGIEANARIVITTYSGSDTSGDEQNRTLSRSDNTGAFSLITPIEVGTNYVNVCAYDRAENENCSGLFVTRVESQPCVNITSTRFTADSIYHLTGNVCPSVNDLALTIDGSPEQIIELNDDLTFEHPITLIEEGTEVSLTLRATAIDGEVAIAEMNAFWDDSPPLIVISSPSVNTCSREESVEFCGRVVDPESGTASVHLNRNPLDLSDQFNEGEQWWEGFCTSVNLTVPQGRDFFEQTITLSGSNGAGISAENSVTVIVDRVAPTLIFDPPLYEDWYRPDRLGRVELSGQILFSGCSLTSSNPIEMVIDSGEVGTLILESGSRFRFLTAIDDGEYQLNTTLNDRAGNTAQSSYDFKVDREGPTLNLLSPNQRSVSQDEVLTVIIEGEDLGSGVLPSSGLLMSNGQATPLTPRLLDANTSRYELSASINLSAGTHPLTLTLTDRLGNESTLELTYIRDISPPTINILSPQLDQDLPDFDQIWLEVNDELSQITEVSVNGVQANQRGDLWLAEGVSIDRQTPRLEVEASDEAGNLASEGAQDTSYTVTLGALSWQGPDRIGTPHRGQQLSDLSLSPDSGEGLGSILHLLWAADYGAGTELLMAHSLIDNFVPSPLSGLSNNAVGSLGNSGLYPQSTLPSGHSLLNIERASIRGVLTLVTRQRVAGANNEQGSTLHLWQRFSELLSDTERVNSSPASPESWVEVRLGLPPTLVASVFSIGDVNGDGLLDLITCNTTGAFLFRQSVEGEFIFDGQAGLTQRGLSSLGENTLKLWWVDLNGDGLRDLVEQTNQELNAWLVELSAGEYNFNIIPNFPMITTEQTIDGWLTIDWDGDGVLDPIAWSSGSGSTQSYLRRYLQEDTIWTSLPIVDETSLPFPLHTVLVVDIDVDNVPELFCASPEEMVSLEANNGSLDINLPALPIVDGSSSTIDQVIIADHDQDGDEDLLFALHVSSPNTANDFGSLRGELWALNHSPRVYLDTFNPIRLTLKRQNAEAVDGIGVSVLIDLDDDLLFDEIFTTRSFSETFLNTRGEGSVNLQIVFPDHSIFSDHTITEYNIEHGSTLTLTDPQD